MKIAEYSMVAIKRGINEIREGMQIHTDNINRAIAEGRQPLGPPNIQYIHNYVIFIQPMVKYE